MFSHKTEPALGKCVVYIHKANGGISCNITEGKTAYRDAI